MPFLVLVFLGGLEQANPLFISLIGDPPTVRFLTLRFYTLAGFDDLVFACMVV